MVLLFLRPSVLFAGGRRTLAPPRTLSTMCLIMLTAIAPALHGEKITRRLAIASAGGAAAAVLPALPAIAADTALVDKPFEWSAAYGAATSDASPKRKGLPLAEVAKVIEADLRERKYILTGDMTTSVFSDEARFQDPNNAVDGLSRYKTALSLLFRPEESGLEDVRVTVNQGANTIEADYVAYGTLKLPWRPSIAPWAGHIVYSIDPDSGLVASQVDVWNITRFDAVRQTFTPGS